MNEQAQKIIDSTVKLIDTGRLTSHEVRYWLLTVYEIGHACGMVDGAKVIRAARDEVGV